MVMLPCSYQIRCCVLTFVAHKSLEIARTKPRIEEAAAKAARPKMAGQPVTNPLSQTGPSHMTSEVHAEDHAV
eukprot:s1377_g5.t1